MIKIATRSLKIRDDIDMRIEIGRAFIEAYMDAQRQISMPWLTHVETKQQCHDLQFVLTFESVYIRTEVGDNTVNYVFNIPRWTE